MFADGDERRRWSAWLQPVAACGAVAFCAAAFVWGTNRTMAMIAPFLLVSAATGLAMFMTRGPDADRVPHPARPTRRTRELAWWCLVAVAGASIVLCLVVLGALSPWLALGTAAALALTTPPARARLSAWTGARRGYDGQSSGPGPVPDALPATSPAGTPGGPPDAGSWIADVETAQLCRLWRATFWSVRDLHDPEQTLRVVELRRAVLEELERRHPDEVDRWLSSGHHVADGPSRYL